MQVGPIRLRRRVYPELIKVFLPFGFYADTQRRSQGFYDIYGTPSGGEVMVTDVITFPNVDSAINYFYNEYIMKFPDGIFLGPVTELHNHIKSPVR